MQRHAAQDSHSSASAARPHSSPPSLHPPPAPIRYPCTKQLTLCHSTEHSSRSRAHPLTMTDADQKNVGEAAIEAETPGNVEAVTLPPKEAETVGQGPATSVDSVTEHAESEKVDTAEAKESTEVAKKESEKTETTEVKKLPTSDQRPKRPVEKNIKFDASLMPESNDPAEIRKQVLHLFHMRYHYH